MKILVCISHVPDTTSKIRFVNDNKDFDKADIQYIIGPYDELALTRALDLKDAYKDKDIKVTVVNVGAKETEPTIRKALAIGADEAIRINAEPTDAYAVAAEIAEAVKEEKFDLIFVGKESIDYNGGLVGDMLAEFLDIQSVSASKIDFEGDKVLLEREIDRGKEKLEAQLPLLTTGQKGFAIEPRIANMRGIRMARRKPLKVVEPKNIEALSETQKHALPEPKGDCKMVDAENVAELVRLLNEEAKVI